MDRYALAEKHVKNPRRCACLRKKRMDLPGMSVTCGGEGKRFTEDLCERIW